MSNKKILVTGGAGYIGSILCEHFLKSGFSVVLYDCFFFGKSPVQHLLKNPNLTVVEGDICNTESLSNLLEPGMDVIHLASLANDPSCDLDPQWSMEINHYATVRLAEQARNIGCQRFIFASSCSVYGYGGDEFLKETSICNPVSLYAELKLKSEEEILRLADDTFCPTILRQATIFGYSRRMRFDIAINQMTMHALTRGKIYVLGGGQQWRPFLHIRDAVELFRRAIETERDKVFKQVFNAGSSDNNFRIHDLARRVKDNISGVEIEVIPDDADRRDYHVDFSKINNHLGFKPKVTLSQGIAEIADFIRMDEKKDYTTSEYFNLQRLKELIRDGRKIMRHTTPRY